MSGIWAVLAAWCMTACVLAATGRPGRTGEESRDGCFTWNPTVALMLELVRAALEQGSSIPRALEAVGGACSPHLGERCARVAQALDRGVPWEDAWDVGEGEAMALLRDTLRRSWTDGAGAVGQLEAALELADTRERMRIERAASRLSVGLLLPTGLCFLPAFLCVGVVPAIISFTQG
ncbi:type II secretion system F family protein [Bifidobacterium cuniculi]|uniref:Type II secretion system protein, pilus assembly n=1 Tax=Bifidobacterium cuniculi TaxID=1688 RepID=A0A087B2R3_9BIFI|nr:type II secretion system F family protein [Bifidobacterium cuniculi]KFI65313.1 type II secretion system protein, pilus assembly [Bifidobacterium cuniculi]